MYTKMVDGQMPKYIPYCFKNLDQSFPYRSEKKIKFLFFYYRTDAYAHIETNHQCLASVLTLHIIGTKTDFFNIHLSIWKDLIPLKVQSNTLIYSWYPSFPYKNNK